jgi:hypothetical protein
VRIPAWGKTFYVLCGCLDNAATEHAEKKCLARTVFSGSFNGWNGLIPARNNRQNTEFTLKLIFLGPGIL